MSFEKCFHIVECNRALLKTAIVNVSVVENERLAGQILSLKWKPFFIVD